MCSNLQEQYGDRKEATLWKGYCNSPLEAEMITTKLAPQQNVETKWIYCVLATDCKQVLQEIYREGQTQTKLTNITTKFREYIDQVEGLHLEFEGRVANKLADFWAKEARKL